MVLTVAANIGAVTVGDVYIGDTKLTKTTHYTVVGGVVTIKATRLDDLTKGNHTVTIQTNQGNVLVVITVADTTALTADPATATFDKNAIGQGYVDVAIEVKHNTTGVTLTSVKNGETTLTATSDYTAVGLVVTLLKTYLDDLEVGEATITFNTNKGDAEAVITVVDTTEAG